jgi:periplasmic protein TonB
VRRRALMISILAQCAFLAALVLVPLLGKTERIALGREYVPIPPYGHPRQVVHGDRTRRNTGTRSVDHTFTFNPNAGRPLPHAPATGTEGPESPSDIVGLGSPSNTGTVCTWCVPGDKNSGPRPPQPAATTPEKPRMVHVTQLDPARLIRRVEPVYPALAKQIHMEGRVELHAIISTDGTIQSLEIVGGDPIFYFSAREAVSQWRYQPTILNGQPVEVDTHITVIYTMQH